jgi:hypothetical protein
MSALSRWTLFSSQDESPKRHTPADTSTVALIFWRVSDVPKCFANHGESTVATPASFLRKHLIENRALRLAR